MSKRNFWTYKETSLMLSIIDELKWMLNCEGKKLTELYPLVEKEMKVRGCDSRNAKQIEFRWKNLRRSYIQAKRNNNKNEGGREILDFYDEMDKILGLSTTTSFTSAQNCDLIGSTHEAEYVEEDNTILPATVEADTDFKSPPLKKRRAVRGIKRDIEPYEEEDDDVRVAPKPNSSRYGKNHLDMVASRFEDVTSKMNRDFVRKQKDLIAYECELFSTQEQERYDRFKEIMDANTDKFLNGLERILRSKGKRKDYNKVNSKNLGNFFSSWDPIDRDTLQSAEFIDDLTRFIRNRSNETKYSDNSDSAEES